ncbi:yhhN family domain protein [Mycobacterium xenopi 4042]|uniref:YhhN family domain protein n=1 Tax=Mycobacterium xenopi 4042 TaxID=1299334 RepID=X7YRK7_MYCXE|nr:yhhN family domain protein [Mycobacterium xenopi 4042]
MLVSSTRRSGCTGRRGRSCSRCRTTSTPSSAENRNGTLSSTFSKMGSIAGPVLSKLGMGAPYAPCVVVGAWVAAGWFGVGYGMFLTVTALRSSPGAELTGHWVAQPAFKAAMALLLAVAPRRIRLCGSVAG